MKSALKQLSIPLAGLALGALLSVLLSLLLPISSPALLLSRPEKTLVGLAAAALAHAVRGKPKAVAAYVALSLLLAAVNGLTTGYAIALAAAAAAAAGRPAVFAAAGAALALSQLIA